MSKQYRQLTSELDQMDKKFKEEEGRFQSSQFESRKQTNELGILKQKIEELKEENEAEMALERYLKNLKNLKKFLNFRKRNSEKMEKLIYEVV